MEALMSIEGESNRSHITCWGAAKSSGSTYTAIQGQQSQDQSHAQRTIKFDFIRQLSYVDEEELPTHHFTLMG